MLLVSEMILILLAMTIASVFILRRKKSFDGEEPPSPFWLPIIGHLHHLAGYPVAYQAFNYLGKKYGDIIKLQLGSVTSVVINGQKNIRDILYNKGHLFDSRPNFQRYALLFGGNKDNSLAFCDWSEKQKLRREMLRMHTFPRSFTGNFFNLAEIITTHTDTLISNLQTAKETKPHILSACANIFTQHFCSKIFELDDPKFIELIENFDEVFYEVNQGYAADFLPVLLPLHYKNIKKMNNLTHKIRNFVEQNLIGDRYQTFVDSNEIKDYVDSLVNHVKHESDPKMCWDGAMFALEDIIGGHTAVGNYVMKVLGYLAKEFHVQEKIQNEIDRCTKISDGFRKVTIADRNDMTYTDATLLEAIRLIASPIVPRVANQDTFINGYRIKEGTLLFLNNYDLSMSNDLWSQPEIFQPERFLQNGQVVKPEHFLPFGGGRRSCMGYKIVQFVSFGIISKILQEFNILPNGNYEVPVGSLALPKNTFTFSFVKRKRN